MDNRVWRRGSSRKDGAESLNSLVWGLESEGQSSLISPEQLAVRTQSDTTSITALAWFLNTSFLRSLFSSWEHLGNLFVPANSLFLYMSYLQLQTQLAVLGLEDMNVCVLSGQDLIC